MPRKRFSELHPLTYAIAVKRLRMKRHVRNLFSRTKYAKDKSEPLPFTVYHHVALMRHEVGYVDTYLQDNKAVNLSISSKKISGVIIKPNETFSFWHLVGNCTSRKGYMEGLVFAAGKCITRIGGGMCQFTNLIHWLVLHSPLTLTEHHHHDGVDMFPDLGRTVPFGCGTSIMYNYLDYRFTNNTVDTFQLMVHTNDTHICGELRASARQHFSYEIKEKDARFVKIGDDYYRKNTVIRETMDKRTGHIINNEIIRQSHALVMYEINESISAAT